ncbi:hypothetical protein EII20_03920 [Comamonadaceae bacterium OH2545_COT-014]|nr:hypothetical protein EII20_03920 [Comamonadaceae bacterium OH2545_COT-014]
MRLKKALSCLALCWCALAALAVQAQPQAHAGLAAIEVAGAEFNHDAADGRHAGAGVLHAMGTLRNTGGQTLESPVVEARFYDAQGKLIDALTDSIYDVTLPPGQEAVVRLDGAARFPAERYARVELRLLSAGLAAPEAGCGDDCASGAASPHSDWLDELRPWWPFFLIMLPWGVWGLLHVRRNRTITAAIVQSQVQLLERQTQALEALAAAAQGAAMPAPGKAPPSSSVR